MPSILVIEADEASALLIQKIFEGSYEVKIALGGQKGLEALGKNKVDLIITCLHLHDMEGWNLIAQVRSVNNLPILVVTASMDSLSKKLAFEAGCNAYLTKPYKIAELKAAVESLILPNSENSPV